MSAPAACDIVTRADVVTRLGPALLEARTAANMTQAELARRFGYSTSSLVSFWEGGQRLPSIDDIVALARVLNRPVRWFLGDLVVAEPRTKIEAIGRAFERHIEQSPRDIPPLLRFGEFLAWKRAGSPQAVGE